VKKTIILLSENTSVAKRLANFGYQVEHITNPIETWAYLDGALVLESLIVLDGQMSDMTAFEFLAAYRQWTGRLLTPALVMYYHPRELEGLLSNTSTSAIRKPLVEWLLKRYVETLI